MKAINVRLSGFGANDFCHSCPGLTLSKLQKQRIETSDGGCDVGYIHVIHTEEDADKIKIPIS
jgi:hypothetical protein